MKFSVILRAIKSSLRKWIPTAGVCVALAACAGQSGPTPAQVANDVQIISTSLTSALATSGLNVPPQVTAAVMDLNAVAKSLSGSESMNSMQPLIVRISDDLNVVIATLDGIPGLPPTVAKALAAAEVILPVVETAVGLVVPAPAPAA